MLLFVFLYTIQQHFLPLVFKKNIKGLKKRNTILLQNNNHEKEISI